jgi:hypothetical protein
VAQQNRLVTLAYDWRAFRKSLRFMDVVRGALNRHETVLLAHVEPIKCGTRPGTAAKKTGISLTLRMRAICEQ